GSGNCRRGVAGRSRTRAFFARARSIDVSRLIDGKGGDFLLWCAVKDEGVAGGRNAINQPATIRAGDQISFWIQGENADVYFVALEEERVLAGCGDLVDFAPITRGDVKISGIIDGEVPDVFGARVKVNTRSP